MPLATPVETADHWPWPMGMPDLLPVDNEVHVWWVDLRQPPERIAKLAASLTEEERRRAAQFRFPEHRDRFIVSRGVLRELLGTYLGWPAAQLSFSVATHGKPVLAGIHANTGLQFNVSHSAHGALYAVAHREVGVDLERCDRALGFAALIERICAPRERAWFQAQPVDLQKEMFFCCWTRKEAIVKATGGGIASGLRDWEICTGQGVPPEHRSWICDAQDRRWSVLSLPLGPGWAGALAMAGWGWRWRAWRLQDGATS